MVAYGKINTRLSPASLAAVGLTAAREAVSARAWVLDLIDCWADRSPSRFNSFLPDNNQFEVFTESTDNIWLFCDNYKDNIARSPQDFPFAMVNFYYDFLQPNIRPTRSEIISVCDLFEI